MKSGINIFNNLENFFKLVIKNNNYSNIIQKANNTQWITIFEKKDSKLILGISQIGEWVFKDERSFYILKDKKEYLYCAKLLEVDYYVIQKQVEERFKNILQSEEISICTIFPFFEIVEFAFSNLFDDYWFNLAWMWYEKFSLSERYKLVALLENISNDKKISQKNRQRARKEVRELENATRL